jgi:DNA polymerase-3 subunit beta
MSNSFSVDQKNLNTVLAAMQPICNRRTTLESTAAIYFLARHKELILKSTDLEISLQYSCPIEQSELTGDCAFLLSGKRIFDLVKELDGEIKFTIDSNMVSIQAGAARLSLNLREIQDFPPFPERIENLMHLESRLLLDMLEKVAFVIPQNNSNPALNGLLLEISPAGLTMTATDGHCLAQASSENCKLAQNNSWLLPRRAIFELKKLVETASDGIIFLGICDKQLVFSGESFNFFSKLLVDSFPEYKPILSKDGFQRSAIKRADFMKTLKRSACLLSGQFIAAKFDFYDSELNVLMNNKEVGSLQEILKLTEHGDQKLGIRFYAPYILNGLQVFSEPEVKFYLKSSAQPIIFESSDERLQYTYLAMPVSPDSTQAQ